MRTSIQQQFRAYLTRESVVWFVLALGSCVVLIVFTASTMFGYQPPTWIGFVFSVIAAISAVGMTYRGMGTRPVPDAELAGIADSSLWHTTRAEWKVEKEIVLDPVYCRFLARMVRADRPLTRAKRAVWPFVSRPDHALLQANVSAQRAGVLYELAVSESLNPKTVFRRGDAVAITVQVHFKVLVAHPLG